MFIIPCFKRAAGNYKKLYNSYVLEPELCTLILSIWGSKFFPVLFFFYVTSIGTSLCDSMSLSVVMRASAWRIHPHSLAHIKNHSSKISSFANSSSLDLGVPRTSIVAFLYGTAWETPWLGCKKVIKASNQKSGNCLELHLKSSVLSWACFREIWMVTSFWGPIP